MLNVFVAAEDAERARVQDKQIELLFITGTQRQFDESATVEDEFLKCQHMGMLSSDT